MLLVDKVAIVTGGASGIGTAASQLFAREGATVILMDRSESGIDVANEIRQPGGTASFIRIDMRHQHALHPHIQAILDEFGSIDVLFSNAGINPHIGNIEATSDGS